MATILNGFQLIAMALIGVALLGTLIALLLQLTTEVRRSALHFEPHGFEASAPALTTQVAVESRFDVKQDSANSPQKYAA
jgi:hypothetical protein